jgi:hypothetical protein
MSATQGNIGGSKYTYVCVRDRERVLVRQTDREKCCVCACVGVCVHPCVSGAVTFVLHK